MEAEVEAGEEEEEIDLVRDLVANVFAQSAAQKNLTRPAFRVISKIARNAGPKWSKDRQFNYFVRCSINSGITDSFSIVLNKTVFISIRTKIFCRRISALTFQAS